jgi:hypothetical protein
MTLWMNGTSGIATWTYLNPINPSHTLTDRRFSGFRWSGRAYLLKGCIMYTKGKWEVSGSVMERKWLNGSLHLNRMVKVDDAESNYPTLAEIYERNNPNEAEANAQLIAAAPDLLEACKEAAKLIQTARKHFPKSIKDSDKFKLENTCATIGTAIFKATGGLT